MDPIEIGRKNPGLHTSTSSVQLKLGTWKDHTDHQHSASELWFVRLQSNIVAVVVSELVVILSYGLLRDAISVPVLVALLVVLCELQVGTAVVHLRRAALPCLQKRESAL